MTSNGKGRGATPPYLGNRALPDFIIIGAQKSATTSLLAYLGRHPQIRLGTKKATHYFDLHHDRDPAWYAGHFPRLKRLPLGRLAESGAKRSWLTGESCPSYMFLPDVPARVQALLPDVRLIAILRHPVDRLVSQYYHEKRKHRAAPGFSAFVAQSRNMAWPPPCGPVDELRQRAAVPRGYYAAQLAHWQKFFAPEQIHVASFEEMLRNPEGTLNGIFRFLGLPPSVVDTSDVRNSGKRSEREEIDPAVLADLQALYDRANEGLEGVTGRSFGW